MTSAAEQVTRSGSEQSASGRRVVVAVIFGGRSGEHPVSCMSAKAVIAHLDPKKFTVIAIGITRQGGWVQVDPCTVGAADKGLLPEVCGGIPVALLPDPTAGSRLCLRIADSAGHLGPQVEDADIDVVFPVLHGPQGEDGTIQGLLELRGIPYVGPGVLASAAGMDKEFTKKLLAAAGLEVGDYVVLRPADATVSQPDRKRLGLPVFVKPARAGSSLGVTKVDDWAELSAAIELARQTDPKVLVEAAVIGREVECGVLESPDGSLLASPPAEIQLDPAQHFYDFAAKYVDDAATFDIPAALPPGTAEQIGQWAIAAFRALDAQGLARVDFFVRPQAAGTTASPDGSFAAGRMEVIINEVNTMPGFTPISMYPRVFQAAGIEFAELLETLIATALARGTGLR